MDVDAVRRSIVLS
jgi:hypothetical protein